MDIIQSIHNLFGIILHLNLCEASPPSDHLAQSGIRAQFRQYVDVMVVIEMSTELHHILVVQPFVRPYFLRHLLLAALSLQIFLGYNFSG